MSSTGCRRLRSFPDHSGREGVGCTAPVQRFSSGCLERGVVHSTPLIGCFVSAGHSPSCPLCGCVIEDDTHVLCKCPELDAPDLKSYFPALWKKCCKDGSPP